MIKVALVVTFFAMIIPAHAEGTDWFCSFSIVGESKAYLAHWRVQKNDLRDILAEEIFHEEGSSKATVTLNNDIAIIAHKDHAGTFSGAQTTDPSNVYAESIIIEKRNGTFTSVSWATTFEGVTVKKGTCRNGNP